MHEIGRSRSAAHAQGEARVEIARRGDPFERDAQSLVEGVRGPGRVVETEKAHVDAPLGEGRQEREQMPLGTADPTDPMDVEDLHRTARRRASVHSSVAAASTAIRKSVATR